MCALCVPTSTLILYLYPPPPCPDTSLSYTATPCFRTLGLLGGTMVFAVPLLKEGGL